MKDSASASILVVEDNPASLEVIRRNLEAKGHRVLTACAVRRAIDLLGQLSFDLVVTDLRFPGENGLELVKYVRDNFSETEVMLVTGYASIQGAVEALKAGATEYLVKPFTEDELAGAVDRSLAQLRIRRAAHSPSSESFESPPGLLGESSAMREVFNQISRASQTMATTLISGESGTGKELVARAIHYLSPRRSAPFVPVSCDAIPENLLESELFGHVKGAFTGAVHNRPGFFQTAEHGTIFLDEVGETSLSTQTKLLRVLQEKEICLVGSSRPRRIDVRIIAATNRDLSKLVRQGAFREDLFYRIHVLTIELPPLRARGHDILLLLNHFGEKYASEVGRAKLRFSDSALQALLHYHWPGNVRELQNLIQRFIVMKDGDFVDAPDLPSPMRSLVAVGPVRRSLAEAESHQIRTILVEVRGNRSQAAKILGISRKTLRVKIRKYGIEPEGSS